MGRGALLTVPWEAFSTRELKKAGNAGFQIARPVREELGILAWSAVAQAGATLITGLDANVNLWHSAQLPEVQ